MCNLANEMIRSLQKCGEVVRNVQPAQNLGRNKNVKLVNSAFCLERV